MKTSLKNWTGTVAVIGVDWGDSGKGRLIDDLSPQADIVARFNGGANTGHTVKNSHGEFALHIIPSGIFNSRALNLVGRNVLLDCQSLSVELNQLSKAKVSFKNLVIDSQATLVMPWHKMRDGIREKLRSSGKVGTTGKGVGPAYADRTERVGLLVEDLLSKDFKQKLIEEIKIQNEFFNLKINAQLVFREYSNYSKLVKPFIGNTTQIVKEAVTAGKNILFEGAQGYFLDIDSGTYPFVTSSNTGVIGIWRSYDTHPSEVSEVVAITKAYTTRVGEGPMPTKITGKDAQHIIKKGREVGTTTGRVRSPGWLDLVLINFAKDVNKLTAIAITKLDVLSGLKKIKLCTSYKSKGKVMNYQPHNADFLGSVTPIYEEFNGWTENITGIRSFEKLPKNAKQYLLAIEKYTKLPIKFISVGPERGQVIYK